MAERLAGSESTENTPSEPTIADGVAVKRSGALNTQIITETVNAVLLADEPVIEEAVQELVEREKIVAEGGGASGVAVLIANRTRFEGRKVCIVVSGGNINARLLSSVLMRGLARGGGLARLQVEIPDQPGTLSKVASIVGAAGGNIVEVSHQRLFHNVPVKISELDLTIESQDARHVHRIRETLTSAGYRARLR